MTSRDASRAVVRMAKALNTWTELTQGTRPGRYGTQYPGAGSYRRRYFRDPALDTLALFVKHAAEAGSCRVRARSCRGCPDAGCQRAGLWAHLVGLARILDSRPEPRP